MFGKKSAANLEFKVLGDNRFIVEEDQNQMRVLQYGMWGDKGTDIDENKCKWDVRTVFISKDGEEIMGKGTSFTENGINELTRILVEQGKGNTKELLRGMQNRNDFMSSLKHVLKNEKDIDVGNIDDEYFDPSSIFNIDEEDS